MNNLSITASDFVLPNDVVTYMIRMNSCPFYTGMESLRSVTLESISTNAGFTLFRSIILNGKDIVRDIISFSKTCRRLHVLVSSDLVIKDMIGVYKAELNWCKSGNVESVVSKTDKSKNNCIIQ
jgi:hypothetical protein